MCTFGVLGLSCETPAAPKPSGFHTTAREPKRAHFMAPSFKNTTKIQREDTQRDTKRAKRWREREEKERNFGRSRRRAVQEGLSGGGRSGGGRSAGGRSRGGQTHNHNKTEHTQHTTHNTQQEQQQHNSNNTTATTTAINNKIWPKH